VISCPTVTATATIVLFSMLRSSGTGPETAAW
jgi:hypothetical protein